MPHGALRVDPAWTSIVRAHAERVLTRMLVVLERAAAGEQAGGQLYARFSELSQAIEEGCQAAAARGVELPDQQLARRFGLDPIEIDILWLAALPHLDPAARPLIRRAHEGKPSDYVDGALCVRLLAGDLGQRLDAQHALRPGARLLDSGLCRLIAHDNSANRLHHELSPAGHLVWFLSGARALGPAGEPYARLIHPALSTDDVAIDDDERSQLSSVLSGFFARDFPSGAGFHAGGLDFARGVALLMHGKPGSGRTLAVKAIAGSLGRDLIMVDAPRLLQAPPAAAAECVRALCHEAAAYGEILVLRDARELMAPGTALAGALAAELGRQAAALLLISDEDGPLDRRLDQVLVLRVHHQAAGAPDALAWLMNMPGECRLDPALDLDRFAGSLRLTRSQIRKAAHLAYLTAGAADGGAGGAPLIDAPTLEFAARSQLHATMGNLAEVQNADLRLEDLILAPDSAQQIREIISAVRNRDTVLRRWGLQARIKRGLAICCLFDGEPGTGKTMAADVIAGELGLTTMRINVAGIVDKYIGETEKNLTRIFEQARPDTTLLLFDEADSLFSKRTEVSHAVDRYSNMDINVLLQLVEQYEGVAILTTNLKRGIDSAFERRIMFKVRFEKPDAEQRERIWRALLPPSLPTAESIDFERLARLELAGGDIKNAVLRAAYAAAHDGGRMTLRHLLSAANRDSAARGRLVKDDEVQD